MTRRESVWIAEIEASDTVLAKVNHKHGVTLDDVKEASLCGAADKVAWDDDPDRGLRLLVIGRTADGRTLKIVLYPDETDDGRFFLATAFRDSA